MRSLTVLSLHILLTGEGLLGADHTSEVHSDGEGGSFGDEHGHQSGLLAPERAMSEDGEISRSTGAISVGSARDRLTFAERLQTVIGYPDVEEVIGGNRAVAISALQRILACLVLSNPRSIPSLDYSCWLIRSVPIPGHLYMTPNRICFYAKLPNNQVRTSQGITIPIAYKLHLFSQNCI